MNLNRYLNHCSCLQQKPAREEDATLHQLCYLSLPVTVDQDSYDGTTFLGESISLSPSTQLPGPADDVDVVWRDLLEARALLRRF